MKAHKPKNLILSFFIQKLFSFNFTSLFYLHEAEKYKLEIKSSHSHGGSARSRFFFKLNYTYSHITLILNSYLQHNNIKLLFFKEKNTFFYD